MERVKNILQRLQELYYAKHQKSAIDVDLMLDYTRVMYADLLEWRKEFKDAPATTETAEQNKEVQTHVPEKPAPVAVAAEETPSPVEEKAPAPEPAKTEEAAVTETVKKPEVQEEVKPVDKAYQPMQHDDPAPKEPVAAEEDPVVEITPEKVPLEVLQTDTIGISFEPPVAPEPWKEIKEELQVEPPAVNPVVEEKPVPPASAIPLPDMNPKKEAKPEPANLFQSVKMPRDIRGAIGINDKYLFLNELFDNHKSNYEETLDQLNHFSTAEQAEDWIRTKVALARKWDEEDATVESFYALLSRHFSER